jgi:hypothetical protein
MFSFFDRLRTGWHAAGACWDVLKRDKTLVVFPLLSGLCCLVVLASFALPLAVIKPPFLAAFLDDRADPHQVPIWFWAVLFAFYFANYFVIYFFNAALLICAMSHFRREPISASEGLQLAAYRLPQLAAWALVSATVGLILKVLENAHEKVGAIASALLGASWTVVTYFAVPVLVVEGVGPLKAIERSWQVLKRTWGESIGGHAGVGWALLPFYLIGLLVVLLGALAMTKSVALGVVLLVGAVVYMLILGLVDATLKGILLGALYLYATAGEIPAEFDRDVLAGSFTAKA